MASVRVSLTLTVLVALTLSLTTFVAAQSHSSGLEYVPLSPCRVFDSRDSGFLPGGQITEVRLSARSSEQRGCPGQKGNAS
jgi:hypothetical protein